MSGDVARAGNRASVFPLFSITQFLFVFTAVNREFGVFGVDVRYLVFMLLAIELASSLYRRRSERLSFERPGSHLLLFYVFMALSTTGWIWNGLEINFGTTSTIILHAMNFIEVAVIFLNARDVRLRKFTGYIAISGTVLVLGQIAQYAGVDISPLVLDSEYEYVYVGSEHVNLLGQHARYGSFAQDPNYTCLFCVLTLASAFLARKKGFPSFLVVALAVLAVTGIALSWSRTILLGCGATAAILVTRSLAPQSETAVKKVVFLCAIGFCLLVPLLPNVAGMFNLQTVLTRFELWERAYDLFLQSPIFGSGLTSFRSYNHIFTNWYVHAHSTFWSVLAEEGIVGFLLLSTTFWVALRKAHEWPVVLMTVATFMLALTNDISYLQIMPLVFVAISAGEVAGEGVDSVSPACARTNKTQIADALPASPTM